MVSRYGGGPLPSDPCLPHGGLSPPEVGDIYCDILMVVNIEGFLVYRCIYVVYRQPLSEVSRWCCVDDKNFIPIIIDVVLILVNPNLIPSPCPVCFQIYHQESATIFLACLFRDPSAAAGGKTGSVGKAVYITAQLYIYFFITPTP